MLCTEEASRALSPGMHGTTFGGGPLACAVAIAVIDTMRRDNLLDHIRETGKYFVEQLQSLAAHHSAVVEVRGKGLMLGMELSNAELAKHVVAQMMERHIVINRTSETVLRFLPPFILERQHIDQAVQALDEILSSAAAANLSAAVQGAHA
jgi:acetylornithine aminotransferase/acetylornithine/N-succinyldiaminopimelate aminotransferase